MQTDLIKLDMALIRDIDRHPPRQAIVKGIVQAHRGDVWAESQPGKGTTFFFTLPAN